MGRIAESVAVDRLEKCKALLAEGLDLTEISIRLKMDRTTLYRFLCRRGIIKATRKKTSHYARHIKTGDRSPGYNGQEWGKERADPSSLTAEQIIQAYRLNINPARYAWLLLCPRGGHPHK
jgi:hypothetical protein